MKDYYYILGITPNASEDEIRKAYRKLSLKFHPDKNKGDPFFESHFKELLEAYETLSDKDQREIYDIRYKSKNTYHSQVGEIISFQASRSSLTTGDSVTFFWATKNIKYIYLSCYKNPLPPSGKKTIKIHTSEEKEIPITLTAKDNQGKIYSRTVRLFVENPAPATENPPTKTFRKRLSPSFKEIVLLFASMIGIIFLISRSFDRPSFEDQPILSSVEQTTKSIEPQNLSPLTGEETIQEFFSLINDKNYVQAYSLTSNVFWKNFPYFRDSVWGLFDKYEITQQPEIKHYQSKWNADRIYNVKFSGLDPKNMKYENMDYDFHLKKVENEWTIVRMTFSQKNEPWYQDDPLYKSKNDLFVLLFNRPHVILQNYYDNFYHIDSLYKNKEYYNDVLIIHFDDTMISAEEALQKDRNDFQINDIESYGILVNSYSMMTYQYEKLDLVYTPLVYYITKTDGKRIKFEANITAALDTENNKILAIGQDFNMEDLIQVVRSYQ